MALTRVSETVYELTHKDKSYRIVFSLGVKDLLFRAISDSYSRFLVEHPEEGLIPQEFRAKYFKLAGELEALGEEDDAAAKAISDQMTGLIEEIMVVGQKVAVEQEDKLLKNMYSALDAIKYRVWSILLTQRSTEGQITEYISPERVQNAEEFSTDEMLDDLTKLFDLAFVQVQGALKKTQAMAKSLSQMGRTLLQSTTS